MGCGWLVGVIRSVYVGDWGSISIDGLCGWQQEYGVMGVL